MKDQNILTLKYFGSGKIYKYSGKSAVSLSIVDFTEITNIIVPFFLKLYNWYKTI